MHQPVPSDVQLADAKGRDVSRWGQSGEDDPPEWFRLVGTPVGKGIFGRVRRESTLPAAVDIDDVDLGALVGQARARAGNPSKARRLPSGEKAGLMLSKLEMRIWLVPARFIT